MINCPVEKNKEYIVDVIDNGFEGEGIAKINDFTLFVHGAIKGEKVKILIVKVLKSYAYGKIIEIIEKSKYRQCEDCKSYKRCGGCNLRHIDYEYTLKMKQAVVQNLVDKQLKTKIIVKETVGMNSPIYYRNKAQYPVGLNRNNEPIFGVFAGRTHEIIPFENCLIQNPISEEISKYILDFFKENKISIYDENTKKGLLRHIVIKVGIKTNEIMVILVINGKEIPNEKDLVLKLVNKFNNIKTIIKNINTKNTNVILGKENINIYGDGYITDILGEYSFKISALSFYQVNPIQAEKLYNIGVESAKIAKDDIVFDLYCGIGTISMFMSKYAKKVYGVEIVEEAINDAIENAKINNVNNTEFIAGDTELILDNLINKEKINPNVIMLDPPRKGLDEKTISNIIKIQPDRVVYISCNPATLIRDISKLEESYNIQEIQPVDMFPFTSHIETVVLLSRKIDL